MSNLFQRQLEVSLHCLTSFAEKQNQSKNFPFNQKEGGEMLVGKESCNYKMLNK